MSGEILTGFVVILAVIVAAGIINERLIKIPNDIALVLFSFVIGAAVKLASVCGLLDASTGLLGKLSSFNFNEFLMEGILCFMLFSGAGKVHFGRFMSNVKAITSLAMLTTLLSSVIYGLLFKAVCVIFGIDMNIWTCILLGCIVSPTDPIAATSILNKLGLSKNVTSVIEGESLFNDGTGVVLYVFVKSILEGGGEVSFPVLMAKEILGAAAVAFAVSAIMLLLLGRTNDPTRRIFISLLAVSLIYVICERFGFSGVLASVICGIIFSLYMNKNERNQKVVDPEDYYTNFWDVVDTLLNSVLFALIGLSIFMIPGSGTLVILIAAAIILNAVSRASGVFASTLIMGKKAIPNRYSAGEFTLLMTWSALKGGLSLALALSTAEFLSGDAYSTVVTVTYATIFFTIVFQGLSTPAAYRIVEKSKEKRIIKTG